MSWGDRHTQEDFWWVAQESNLICVVLQTRRDANLSRYPQIYFFVSPPFVSHYTNIVHQRKNVKPFFQHRPYILMPLISLWSTAETKVLSF